MYKKVRCTCRVVVLPTKPTVVFDVLVAVALWDLELYSIYRCSLVIVFTGLLLVPVF